MRLEKYDLLKYCRTILDIEQKSEVLYKSYLEKIEDERVRNTLGDILKDEIEHIKIAKELIQILE